MKTFFDGYANILFGIFVIGVILSVRSQIALADDSLQKQLKTVNYSDFLKVRNDANTVVLSAPEIERLFIVVPQEQADAGEGITQVELENALRQIIPQKNTRVILYCYVNFDPLTRRMPARETVGLSLIANGYSNVYELDDLWKDSKINSAALHEIAEKEVYPYTKKIPDPVLKLLQPRIK